MNRTGSIRTRASFGQQATGLCERAEMSLGRGPLGDSAPYPIRASPTPSSRSDAGRCDRFWPGDGLSPKRVGTWAVGAYVSPRDGDRHLAVQRQGGRRARVRPRLLELQRRGDRAAYFPDQEPSRAYANDPARAEPEPSASRWSRPRTRGHSVHRAGNTSRDRLGQLRPPTDLALSLLPVVSACDDTARVSALGPTEPTSLACASSVRGESMITGETGYLFYHDFRKAPAEDVTCGMDQRRT
jgi:hypothetical protein